MFVIKLTTEGVLGETKEHTYEGNKWGFWQWFHNEFKDKWIHEVVAAEATLGVKSLKKTNTAFVGRSGVFHRYTGSKIREIKELVNDIHGEVIEITRPNGEIYQVSKYYFTNLLHNGEFLDGFTWRTL